MKKFLIKFITLLLLTYPCFAQEEMAGFDDRDLPVLNDELRKNDRDINDLQNFYAQKAPTTLTISSGVVTIDQASHSIETEAGGASDNLDTINGGAEGNILTVYAANSARTVVLTDGVGNLKLSGSCTLDNSEDTAILIKTGVNWQLLACTNNGA